MNRSSLSTPVAPPAFLSGSRESFRLQRSGAAVVALSAGTAAIVYLASAVGTGGSIGLVRQLPVSILPGLLAGTLTALLTALLAARWLGNRVGVAAGSLQLASFCMLRPLTAAEADAWFVLASCGCLCIFALAHVDSPRGRLTTRWLSAAFYVGASLAFLVKGPIGLVLIFSVCLLFLTVNQDLRAARFFASPWAIVLLVICLANPTGAAWTTSMSIGERPGFDPAYATVLMLPWLAAWFVIQAVRQGLFTQPLWRFVGGWVAAGLAVLGITGGDWYVGLAAVLPAISLAGAAGLLNFLHLCQRLGQGQHRRLLLITWLVCGAEMAVLAAAANPPGAMGMIGGLALGAAGWSAVFCIARRGVKVQLAAVLVLAWLQVGLMHALAPASPDNSSTPSASTARDIASAKETRS